MLGKRSTRWTVPLVAAAASVVLTANTASAASTTWSSAGRSGVHAQGTLSTSYGYVTMAGYVRDTACDGKLAYIFVTVVVQGKSVVINDQIKAINGCNTQSSFTRKWYAPADSYILVQECIKGTYTLASCGSRYKIWSN